jgi:hypothetical protein
MTEDQADALRRAEEEGYVRGLSEAFAKGALPGMKGAFPVVLFLRSAADRDELIQAFRELKPTARTYKLMRGGGIQPETQA